ncbi:MAG: response regulator [Nitrospiraceae bacterium]|nr:response regulator [Nitrospiraceae bacterium]
MKILVVDDCQTTRRLLGFYLKSKGFEVATAINGLDAMEKMARENVNLVMTDLNMPFMDGIEFIKALRADSSFAGIPVLMVTTEKDAEEERRAIDAGADGFLTKPVTSEVLVRKIKALMKSIFSRGGDNDD